MDKTQPAAQTQPDYPPPAYPPPPAAQYNTYNSYGQPPPAQATTVVLSQPAMVAPRAFGSCPYCGGLLRKEFTAFGILLAIIFFPIGILCCLGMMEMRCVSCRR